MKITQDIKLATDAVVFGYTHNSLKVLLIKQKFGLEKNKWALPGGFVKNNESVKDCVIRELQEETGVSASYLEQLYTFGEVNRDKRFRVVSVAYLALINPSNFELKVSTDAIDAKWFAIDDIPELAFDHKEILQKGLIRLKNKVHYHPIGFDLLAKEFPFSDIENLYQTILDEKIDRRNFRKKILSYGFIQETEKIYKPKTGRPAKLFTYNIDKYKQLQEKGYYLDIKFV